MLKKLLKYELKAMLPIWGVSFLVLLVLSILVRLSVGSAFSMDDWVLPNGVSDLASFFTVMSTTLSCVGFFVALIVVSFLVTYLPAWRFYRTCLKDEGYLTFTLPVKTSSIYASKLIAATLGQYACALVSGISLAIVFLTYPQSSLGSTLLTLFKTLLTDFGISTPPAFAYALPPIYLLIALLTPIYTTTTLFLAFCLGQLAGKSRFLWSVVSYFAITSVTGTVGEIANLLLSIATASIAATTTGILLAQLFAAILALVLLVFFLCAQILVSNWILKKHLNLI